MCVEEAGTKVFFLSRGHIIPELRPPLHHPCLPPTRKESKFNVNRRGGYIVDDDETEEAAAAFV